MALVLPSAAQPVQLSSGQVSTCRPTLRRCYLHHRNCNNRLPDFACANTDFATDQARPRSTEVHGRRGDRCKRSFPALRDRRRSRKQRQSRVCLLLASTRRRH